MSTSDLSWALTRTATSGRSRTEVTFYSHGIQGPLKQVMMCIYRASSKAQMGRG